MRIRTKPVETSTTAKRTTSTTAKRTREIKVRVTPAEEAELKSRAQDHGYAQLAEFIRACALSAQVAHDVRLARDIAHVGELLNALLHLAQATNSPIPRDRIERLLDTAEQFFHAHLSAGTGRG